MKLFDKGKNVSQRATIISEALWCCGLQIIQTWQNDPNKNHIMQKLPFTLKWWLIVQPQYDFSYNSALLDLDLPPGEHQTRLDWLELCIVKTTKKRNTFDQHSHFRNVRCFLKYACTPNKRHIQFPFHLNVLEPKLESSSAPQFLTNHRWLTDTSSVMWPFQGNLTNQATLTEASNKQSPIVFTWWGWSHSSVTCRIPNQSGNRWIYAAV